MPSIFINTTPPSESKILEYIDLIFVCNDEDHIVYNKITIKNTGNTSIDSLSIYTPYSKEMFISKVHANCNSHEVNHFYNDYSEILMKLSPQQIMPGSSLTVELFFKIKCVEKKTKHGFPIFLSFYNLNYVKDLVPLETLNDKCIPLISRAGICLGTICPRHYSFSNNDSTPEIGNLEKKEHNYSYITRAISKISEVFSEESVNWSEFLLWANPQLSTLPDEIPPAYTGRAVKAYFDKYRFIEFLGMKFSHPDVLNFTLAILSILIGAIGIYISIK